MTLRRAIRLFPRPWIDGNVTFQEWLLAGAVIEAAIAKDEACPQHCCAQLRELASNHAPPERVSEGRLTPEECQRLADDKSASGDALTALVAKWRLDAEDGLEDSDTLSACADELAVLISAGRSAATTEAEQLLKEWDTEVREHGLWTSGHSIAARMAKALQAQSAPAPLPAPELTTGQMNNLAMRLIGIRDTLTTIPVPIIQRNIDAAIEELRTMCPGGDMSPSRSAPAPLHAPTAEDA